MAALRSTQDQNTARPRNGSGTDAQDTDRPTEASINATSTTDVRASAEGDQNAGTKKRRGHRGGKKKKARRQSFALGNEQDGAPNPDRSAHDSHAASTSGTPRPSFYRLGQSGRNLSSASLDSQALLDHRYVLSV